MTDRVAFYLTNIMLITLGMTLLWSADKNKTEKDALRSDIVKLTEKLDEAKQVLRKQDSIIRNFSPVITVQIPCEHARK